MLLSDKMGGDSLLMLRESELFLAKLDALYQKCHVASQLAHGLQTFAILQGFARYSSVYIVPIL